MNIDSIFFTQKSEKDCIAGKLTRTTVLETIPPTSLEYKLDNWDNKNTEWRWRFLQIGGDQKSAVEISYQNKGSDRLYFNKHGEWVKRDVPKVYDKYVVKEFYYYND